MGRGSPFFFNFQKIFQKKFFCINKMFYLCIVKTFIFDLILFFNHLLFFMKYIRFVAVMSIAAVSLFGCKSNVTPPVITFGDSPLASVKAGESKEVAIAVKTNGKLKRVSFFRKNNEGEEELFGTPVVKFPNKGKYESVLTLQDISANVTLVVEAVDTKSQTSRAEYVVVVGDLKDSVAAATAGEPAKSAAPSAVPAGAMELGFNANNTVGSSFGVKNNAAFLLVNAKQSAEDIDMMFFNGPVNGVTITAPADTLAEKVFNNAAFGVQTWGTRNATVFVKVKTSFEEVTLTDVEARLSRYGSTHVSYLKEGGVVAFKTASGQIGVVQLTNLQDNATSTFNISVRVLK